MNIEPKTKAKTSSLDPILLSSVRLRLTFPATCKKLRSLEQGLPVGAYFSMARGSFSIHTHDNPLLLNKLPLVGEHLSTCKKCRNLLANSVWPKKAGPGGTTGISSTQSASRQSRPHKPKAGSPRSPTKSSGSRSLQALAKDLTKLLQSPISKSLSATLRKWKKTSTKSSVALAAMSLLKSQSKSANTSQADHPPSPVANSKTTSSRCAKTRRSSKSA